MCLKVIDATEEGLFVLILLSSNFIPGKAGVLIFS